MALSMGTMASDRDLFPVCVGGLRRDRLLKGRQREREREKEREREINTRET